MSKGVELIAAERQRQIEKEGWDVSHDDAHTDGSLADAAACYAMSKKNRESYQSLSYHTDPPTWYPRLWPKSWHITWWKPTPEDRVRELVKAGALIAAEIDRLTRAKEKEE